MKKAVKSIIFILLLPFLFVSTFCVLANLEQLENKIYSHSYLVSDISTGQVYLAKNQNEKMYPASVTKLLTIALVLENCNTQDVITSELNYFDFEPEATVEMLVQGEQMTVYDALMSCALRSANDSANALAQHCSGSVQDFVQLMNDKAKELGCENTNFANPNGLFDENHYTTANDLAKIMQYVGNVEGIFDIIGCKEYEILPTNKTNYTRELENGCSMLFSDLPEYDESIIGGKTGWITESKHTMVTFSKQPDGRVLSCIVLTSRNRADKFSDTKVLLEYCKNNLKILQYTTKEYSITVDNKVYNIDCNTINVAVEQNATLSNINVSAPVIDNNFIEYDCEIYDNQKNFLQEFVYKTPLNSDGDIFNMDFVFANPISSFFNSLEISATEKILFVLIFVAVTIILGNYYKRTLVKIKHQGKRIRRKSDMKKQTKAYKIIKPTKQAKNL